MGKETEGHGPRVYVDETWDGEGNWTESYSPRGRLVTAELWERYQEASALREALSAELRACEFRDDRVLTEEQRQQERKAAEWAMSLIPLDTPFFNAVPRDKEPSP